MSLTEFQQMKMARMFDVFDLNGDGVLEQNDFTRRADHFAAERGWSKDSQSFKDQMDFNMADWQNLQQAADADGDGTVTREEFIAFAEHMLADPAALEQYAYQDAELIFRAMDADGDGRITVDEYEMYLRVYRIDPAGAKYFFDRMDSNGDGFVSSDEIRTALTEYLFSDDLTAPGNFIFGPLDQKLVSRA